MVRMAVADRDLTEPALRRYQDTRVRSTGCQKGFPGCNRKIAARRIGKPQIPVNLGKPSDLVDTPSRVRPFLVIDLTYPLSSKPAKNLIVSQGKDLEISKTQPVYASLTDVSELFPQYGREQEVDRIFPVVVDRSK